MKLELLQSLKRAHLPYLFFWDEWIQYGDCNLSRIEIDKIQALTCNFNPFDWTYTSNDELDLVRNIVKKLQIGLQVFKEFVVVNFLNSVIQLANEYGYDLFLNSPIKNLNISEDLKACLLKFKTYNLKLLFLTHKIEEFSFGWIYKVIVEFQTIKKTELTIQFNKPEFTRNEAK